MSKCLEGIRNETGMSTNSKNWASFYTVLDGKVDGKAYSNGLPRPNMSCALPTQTRKRDCIET